MALIGHLIKRNQCVPHIKMCLGKPTFYFAAPINQTLSAPDDAPGFHDSRLKFPPRFSTVPVCLGDSLLNNIVGNRWDAIHCNASAWQ